MAQQHPEKNGSSGLLSSFKRQPQTGLKGLIGSFFGTSIHEKFIAICELLDSNKLNTDYSNSALLIFEFLDLLNQADKKAEIEKLQQEGLLPPLELFFETLALLHISETIPGDFYSKIANSLFGIPSDFFTSSLHHNEHKLRFAALAGKLETFESDQLIFLVVNGTTPEQFSAIILSVNSESLTPLHLCLRYHSNKIIEKLLTLIPLSFFDNVNEDELKLSVSLNTRLSSLEKQLLICRIENEYRTIEERLELFYQTLDLKIDSETYPLFHFQIFSFLNLFVPPAEANIEEINTLIHTENFPPLEDFFEKIALVNLPKPVPNPRDVIAGSIPFDFYRDVTLTLLAIPNKFFTSQKHFYEQLLRFVVLSGKKELNYLISWCIGHISDSIPKKGDIPIEAHAKLLKSLNEMSAFYSDQVAEPIVELINWIHQSGHDFNMPWFESFMPIIQALEPKIALSLLTRLHELVEGNPASILVTKAHILFQLYNEKADSDIIDALYAIFETPALINHPKLLPLLKKLTVEPFSESIDTVLKSAQFECEVYTGSLPREAIPIPSSLLESSLTLENRLDTIFFMLTQKSENNQDQKRLLIEIHDFLMLFSSSEHDIEIERLKKNGFRLDLFLEKIASLPVSEKTDFYHDLVETITQIPSEHFNQSQHYYEALLKFTLLSGNNELAPLAARCIAELVKTEEDLSEEEDEDFLDQFEEDPANFTEASAKIIRTLLAWMNRTDSAKKNDGFKNLLPLISALEPAIAWSLLTRLERVIGENKAILFSKIAALYQLYTIDSESTLFEKLITLIQHPLLKNHAGFKPIRQLLRQKEALRIQIIASLWRSQNGHLTPTEQKDATKQLATLMALPFSVPEKLKGQAWLQLGLFELGEAYLSTFPDPVGYELGHSTVELISSKVDALALELECVSYDPLFKPPNAVANYHKLFLILDATGTELAAILSLLRLILSSETNAVASLRDTLKTFKQNLPNVHEGATDLRPLLTEAQVIVSTLKTDRFAFAIFLDKLDASLLQMRSAQLSFERLALPNLHQAVAYFAKAAASGNEIALKKLHTFSNMRKDEEKVSEILPWLTAKLPFIRPQVQHFADHAAMVLADLIYRNVHPILEPYEPLLFSLVFQTPQQEDIQYTIDPPSFWTSTEHATKCKDLGLPKVDRYKNSFSLSLYPKVWESSPPFLLDYFKTKELSPQHKTRLAHFLMTHAYGAFLKRATETLLYAKAWFDHLFKIQHLTFHSVSAIDVLKVMKVICDMAYFTNLSRTSLETALRIAPALIRDQDMFELFLAKDMARELLISPHTLHQLSRRQVGELLDANPKRFNALDFFRYGFEHPHLHGYIRWTSGIGRLIASKINAMLMSNHLLPKDLELLLPFLTQSRILKHLQPGTVHHFLQVHAFTHPKLIPSKLWDLLYQNALAKPEREQALLAEATQLTGAYYLSSKGFQFIVRLLNHPHFQPQFDAETVQRFFLKHATERPHLMSQTNWDLLYQNAGMQPDRAIQLLTTPQTLVFLFRKGGEVALLKLLAMAANHPNFLSFITIVPEDVFGDAHHFVEYAITHLPTSYGKQLVRIENIAQAIKLNLFPSHKKSLFKLIRQHIDVLNKEITLHDSQTRWDFFSSDRANMAVTALQAYPRIIENLRNLGELLVVVNQMLSKVEITQSPYNLSLKFSQIALDLKELLLTIELPALDVENQQLVIRAQR